MQPLAEWTKPLSSDIRWARFANGLDAPKIEKIKASSTRPLTAAQRHGLQYEERVRQRMQSDFPISWLPSPWLVYVTSSKPHEKFCQPDGLLIDPLRGVVVICETKTRHCPESFDKLFRLYKPALEVVLRGSPSSGLDGPGGASRLRPQGGGGVRGASPPSLGLQPQLWKIKCLEICQVYDPQVAPRAHVVKSPWDASDEIPVVLVIK